MITYLACTFINHYLGYLKPEGFVQTFFLEDREAINLIWNG